MTLVAKDVIPQSIDAFRKISERRSQHALKVIFLSTLVNLFFTYTSWKVMLDYFDSPPLVLRGFVFFAPIVSVTCIIIYLKSFKELDFRYVTLMKTLFIVFAILLLLPNLLNLVLLWVQDGVRAWSQARWGGDPTLGQFWRNFFSTSQTPRYWPDYPSGSLVYEIVGE